MHKTPLRLVHSVPETSNALSSNCLTPLNSSAASPAKPPNGQHALKALLATSASTSLGSKLQWLALTRPYLLKAIEGMVDRMIERGEQAANAEREDAASPDVSFTLCARTLTYLAYHEHTPGTLLIAPGDFLDRPLGSVLPPDMTAILERGIQDAHFYQRPVNVSYAFRNRAYRCRVQVHGELVALDVRRVIA